MEEREQVRSGADATAAALRAPREVRVRTSAWVILGVLGGLAVCAGAALRFLRLSPYMRSSVALFVPFLVVGTTLTAWAIRREFVFLRDGGIAQATVHAAGPRWSWVLEIGNLIAGWSPGGQTQEARPCFLTYEFAPQRGGPVTRTLKTDRSILRRAFPEGLRLGARFLVAYDPKRPARHQVLRLPSRVRVEGLRG